MEAQVIETVAKAAGIGGIAIGALLLIFRETLRKSIFPKMTREQGYKTIRMILVMVWTVALAGIAAWVWAGNQPPGETLSTTGDGSPIVSGVNGNVNIVNGDGNTVTNNNSSSGQSEGN